MFSQGFLLVVGTVLAAAIRAVNAALGWPRQGDGHVEGADRQILFHPIADGPYCYPAGICVEIAQGNHLARMQVEDDRQINPAFPRP